jgi:hypothetical protein
LGGYAVSRHLFQLFFFHPLLKKAFHFSGAFKCAIEKIKKVDVCDPDGYDAYMRIFETFGTHYGKQIWQLHFHVHLLCKPTLLLLEIQCTLFVLAETFGSK